MQIITHFHLMRTHNKKDLSIIVINMAPSKIIAGTKIYGAHNDPIHPINKKHPLKMSPKTASERR